MRGIGSGAGVCSTTGASLGWQGGAGVALRLRFLSGVCMLCLLAVGLGCSTHAQRLATPRQAFYTNNLSVAQSQFEKLEQKPKGDAAVVQLDLAMLQLMGGQPEQAEARLREVRDEWESLEQASLAESAVSLISDDQKRAYAGEDYEKMLVRVFLTLSSLMHDGVDAESYSLQTLNKHQQIVRDAQDSGNDEIDEAYCIPAIAPYLRGVLREATFSNYDDAERSYRRASELQPESALIQSDLQRVTQGVHSSPGNGVVYVIAMVGRGPYKVETNAVATQQALLIADQIVSQLGKYSLPPTIAPVKVPELVSPPKPFDLVGIEVNGRPATTTLPITDLHELAVRSYQAKRNQVIAWAVARRVIKKGAVYTAKDQLGADGSLASLALDAAGVLWEATESADTRCWGLLPREIQISRLELPAGSHELHLEPLIAGAAIGPGASCNVEVRDAKNAYVLSYWPDTQPIGQILVRD